MKTKELEIKKPSAPRQRTKEEQEVWEFENRMMEKAATKGDR